MSAINCSSMSRRCPARVSPSSVFSTHLSILLQGFTSDPEVLKRRRVEHKLLPRASSLARRSRQRGLCRPLTLLSSMISDATIASNVAQFEAENAAVQSQMRTEYTLDAFNDIAHYLSNIPGRKNLIWFSGSFPARSPCPTPALNDPFSVMYSNDEEFQETTNLLGRAQVAVYPIDARGLMTNPAFSAANSGRSFVGPNGAAAMSKAIRDFGTSQANEHSTMDRMAEATGGHAFYNTNGLAQAVALALDSGANYYTLTYDPANQKWDGNYRNIKVALTGQFATAQLKLTYRRGYYANDPNSKRRELLRPATISTADATAAHAAEAYRRNAISHGAPLPEDILYKVRAIPASATPEDTLAPNNVPDPNKPIKGPFRRFAIDYVALPSDFQLTPAATGNHTSAPSSSPSIFIHRMAICSTATGKTLSSSISRPPTYTNFRKTPVSYRLDISAPVKGETYLRIILHDIPANHFGAIEVPVSAIANLPPVPTPAPVACVVCPPHHHHRHSTKLFSWRYAYLQPALSIALVRAKHILVLGSLAIAILLAHPPHLRATLWLLLPTLGVIAGTADTARCMQRRWSFYHGGVLLCLYMDLLVITLILFFLFFPFFIR